MSAREPWLSIVGIGEDGLAGLGPDALRALGEAHLVIGGRRHLALAATAIQGETLSWPNPIAGALDAILARRGEPVTVLASGDPFCYGAGSLVAATLEPGEWQAFPALSAFSLAAARLGWPLQETDCLSLCGRPLETLTAKLQPGRRMLVLSADASTPAAVASYLDERGFGASAITLLEALGGEDERLRETTAADFALNDVHALNLLAIDLKASRNARVLPLANGLDDSLFEHDGQMTKREVRAVTLSGLAPRAGERLWDIGCGAGSVAIEWLLAHEANSAIGIEENSERAARAGRNAAALGVPRLQLVEGRAPEALAGLPPPNAIFIGGGAHEEGVIDAAWSALRPGGRLVANAVTLESERALTDARARLGGTLLRLAVSRLDAVGALEAYRPAMAVTQWLAVKS